MDDDATRANIHRHKTRKRRLSAAEERSKRSDDELDQEVDVEVWEALSKSFMQVQSVLDQNRALIQQANDNHQSRAPDNLTRNVSLIREINSNISKVISIYSDLSANFSGIVHQHRAAITPAKNDNDSGETGDRKLDPVKSGVESQ
ncbi:protein EARLY FLOWERING 4 [Pyrus x bretschneideri]|uniref:protein EARLY FLOWERING 4 n=1 Tax=Pyrus x bretschneideri TaxID=225117 RepID=UPI00202F33CE|nr:protein EARLY FLOWERING 4 [Pyrus x bretschneideri]